MKNNKNENPALSKTSVSGSFTSEDMIGFADWCRNGLLNTESACSKTLLPAVYWLVIWLLCCIILGSIFYSNIQHQKRVEKIFDNYYKEMSVINGR